MFGIGDRGFVFQFWLSKLTWKMQSVLISSFRGADGCSKEDASKPLVRALRNAVVKDAEEKDRGKPAKFVAGDLGATSIRTFAEDLDRYNVHFVTHLYQAAEIVGYKHPDVLTRQAFLFLYFSVAEALHLLPETEYHLNLRLADRPFEEEERQKYRAISQPLLWAAAIPAAESFQKSIPVESKFPELSFFEGTTGQPIPSSYPQLDGNDPRVSRYARKIAHGGFVVHGSWLISNPRDCTWYNVHDKDGNCQGQCNSVASGERIIDPNPPKRRYNDGYPR